MSIFRELRGRCFVDIGIFQRFIYLFSCFSNRKPYLVYIVDDKKLPKSIETIINEGICIHPIRGNVTGRENYSKVAKTFLKFSNFLEDVFVDVYFMLDVRQVVFLSILVDMKYCDLLRSICPFKSIFKIPCYRFQ